MIVLLSLSIILFLIRDAKARRVLAPKGSRLEQRCGIQTLIDGADFLETVRLLSGAGETLPRSCSRSLAILRRGALADDLATLALSQRMGHSFSEALFAVHHSCGRVAAEIVEALRTAQRLGIEQEGALAALSDEFRSRARAAIEERAARAPTLMLVPLGIFFLPEIALFWLAGAVRDLFAAMGG